MNKAALAALLAPTVALVAFAPSASAQTLRQTPFPDGTGSVGIPAGWQLNGAYKGQVQVDGPGGAAVVFGLPWTIIDPTSSIGDLAAANNSPSARAGDVLGALNAVLVRNGARLTSVRGMAVAPAVPGAPTYLLLYQYTRGGASITALGYFAALTYGPGQAVWQLYSSAVIAPTPRFSALLPTMLRMWRSWRPNGRAPVEGSASAIFDRALQENRDSFEEIQRQFRRLL